MTKVLLDAGPLVAFYSQDDEWHKWAERQLREAGSGPLLTCEPVLAEAAFLIARDGGYPGVFLAPLKDGWLKIGLSVEREVMALDSLMKRYRSVPMSLADACLVRMAENYPDCRLLTLDRDFVIYRRSGRQTIPLTSPWQS